MSIPTELPEAMVSIILRDTGEGHFAVYFTQMPSESEMPREVAQAVDARSPAVGAAKLIMAYLEEHARRVIAKKDPPVKMVQP